MSRSSFGPQRSHATRNRCTAGAILAAPAVAALMLEKDPSLTVEEIREILQETARPISLRFTSARPTITNAIPDIGGDGYSFDAGFGLVDAAAALEAIGP